MTKTEIREATNIAHEALENLQDGLDKLKELQRLIDDPTIKERLRTYIIANIETTLTNEHQWLGGNMFTIEDIIRDIEQQLEE